MCKEQNCAYQLMLQINDRVPQLIQACSRAPFYDRTRVQESTGTSIWPGAGPGAGTFQFGRGPGIGRDLDLAGGREFWPGILAGNNIKVLLLRYAIKVS